LLAGTIKSGVVGLTALGGLAGPAIAADLYAPAAPVEAAAPSHKLGLSATVNMTTDYVFRGISQTAENPAIQGSFDLTYNIFYAGIWASNLDFGGTGLGGDVSNIEIDYYAGITPKWGKWNFDFAALYYTYPGAFDPGGSFDYWEFKTAVSRSIGDHFSFYVANYWSPENFGETGTNNVLEGGMSYSFNKWWIFTPSISGLYGYQWGDDNEGGFDYSYWNAGMTFEFAEKFALDVRYWDSDASFCQTSGLFSCNERVVGSLKASF